MSGQDQNVILGGEPIENVNNFIFLGLDSSAFRRLKRTHFLKTKISIKVKVRLYPARILPIVICASKAWTFTTTEDLIHPWRHKTAQNAKHCYKSFDRCQ